MAKTARQPTKTGEREKLAIWVDNEDLKRMRQYQTDFGATVSETIRRAIKAYVATLPKKRS